MYKMPSFTDCVCVRECVRAIQGSLGVYVYAKCHVSMTSFNERIDVKSRVIVCAVVSPYTLAIIASLSDYGSLSL